MVEKIVQLSEREYDELSELAKLNQSQIEEKALELYKEKGVAEITVKIKNSQDTYCSIGELNCLSSGVSLFYKDSKFYISQKIRYRISDYINKIVTETLRDQYGDAQDIIKEYNKKIHNFKMIKIIVWLIAVSGWILCLLN